MSDRGDAEARSKLLLGIFLVTFCSYASFFNGGGWNQNAHFALTRAIVEKGTLQIDDYRWSTFDYSEYGGHLYANKAPGLSLIAVPVYAVIFHATEPAKRESLMYSTLAAWALTLAVVALPGALLAMWIARHLILSGVSPIRATSVALATALGSMLFPFSSMLFLHTASALFLFLAFDLITRDRRPLLAGVFAGLAGFCNYVCIPLAMGLLLLHVWRRREFAPVLRFAAGAALPALMLAAYQFSAFGNPFATTISTLPEHFVDPDAAGGVMRMPEMATVIALTVSPYRGLFFSMPVLLWGVWALIRGLRSSKDARVVLVMVAGLIVANASFNGWHTGSSYGPRYLIPLIPLIMVFAAREWDALRWLRRAAVAWSVFVAWLATAVNPMVSMQVPNPVTDYLFPVFFEGRLGARLMQLPPDSWKTMTGHVSVNEQSMLEAVAYMIVPRGSNDAAWVAFNLGELVAPGSPVSVYLLAFVAAIATALLLRYAHDAVGLDRRQ